MTTTYEPIPNERGWILRCEGLELEAASPYVDHGQVRAVLTVRQSNVIFYRTTTNLTSERARAKVLAALDGRGITLDDGALVALDEACRQPRPRATTHVDHVLDRGTSFSETPLPLDYAGLEEEFNRHLLIADRGYLPTVCGTVLAHRLEGDPAWLLIVAPPGGTKSEVLRSLYGAPGIFPVSELTARTFASGLDVPGSDPSLLARLKDEILVLKDFTSVLSMHQDERMGVLAQLREIYDGQYDKVWGTGKELHWQGRLGFIAGVTAIIDKHQSSMAMLGERFVLFRLVLPDRRQLALKALAAAGGEEAMRRELSAAMRGFLAARGSEPPTLSDDARSKLATVADFITRARSPVARDGYRRELEYAPEPEAPTRFAKVLASLAQGIALAFDHSEVTAHELRLVLRVALDCLPILRRRVISALAKAAITDKYGRLETSAVAGAVEFSMSAIRRTLEDLQALRVVARERGGPGLPDEWRLRQHWPTYSGRSSPPPP